MRVKLSYTVDEEDVLAESAKMLSLSGDDLQQAVGTFNKLLEELKGQGEPDNTVNLARCYLLIEDLRQALLRVDTRTAEVDEIVRGYDDYQKVKREHNVAGGSSPDAEEPQSAAPQEEQE